MHVHHASSWFAVLWPNTHTTTMAWILPCTVFLTLPGLAQSLFGTKMAFLRTEAGNCWLFAIGDGDKGVKSLPVRITIK